MSGAVGAAGEFWGSSCLRAQSAEPVDVFGVGVGASLWWVGGEVPG